MAKSIHKNVLRSAKSVQPKGKSTAPQAAISKRSTAVDAFGQFGGSVVDFTLGASVTKNKAGARRTGKTL